MHWAARRQRRAQAEAAAAAAARAREEGVIPGELPGGSRRKDALLPAACIPGAAWRATQPSPQDPPPTRPRMVWAVALFWLVFSGTQGRYRWNLCSHARSSSGAGRQHVVHTQPPQPHPTPTPTFKSLLSPTPPRRPPLPLRPLQPRQKRPYRPIPRCPRTHHHPRRTTQSRIAALIMMGAGSMST